MDSVNAESAATRSPGGQHFSPVEFELSLEKITIRQIIDFFYTEFSEENENGPCQVVSFEEKRYGQFLNFSLFLFSTVIYRVTEKNTIKHINGLSYTEFSQEYETNSCQAVSPEKKKL